MSTQTQQIKQATDSLAAEIQKRHKACQSVQNSALKKIEDTIAARIEVARLVEAAHASIGSGCKFAQWWRERKLPVGWAEKYLRLAKTADRHTLGDKNQLRLIGLLPEAEESDHSEARESNPFCWTKWAGKIKMTLTLDRINGMSRIDREIAARQLEPLVKVYNQLTSKPALPVATPGKESLAR